MALLLIVIFTLNPVSARYVGVTGVEITPQYVHVSSAYPTASVDGGYFRHTNLPYFQNYCPGCGHKECIDFEQSDPSNGVISGFTSVEGMFYCIYCDRDYSCISGIDHGYEGIYLQRYVFPNVEKKNDTKESDYINVNGVSIHKEHIKTIKTKSGLDYLSLKIKAE